MDGKLVTISNASARTTTASAPTSCSGTTRALTKTYNRFHDPDEPDHEIAQFREMHAAMDRAVLYAYGWTDIPTDCEFLLDYEIDEEDWSTRKKPYRYRWPNDVRDEVLARLLELNAERANEEALAGASGAGPGATRPVTRQATGQALSPQAHPLPTNPVGP